MIFLVCVSFKVNSQTNIPIPQERACGDTADFHRKFCGRKRERNRHFPLICHLPGIIVETW